MTIDIPTMDWRETEGIAQLQNKIVRSSNLSENGKQQLRLLLSIVSKEAAQNENFSYHNLKESIKMLEQRWLNNNYLPVKDTNILQMAASIGRYSAYYWSGGGTKLPIAVTPNQETTLGSSERIIFKNVVRFIATVQWDMTGFIKGYVGGSVKHAASEAAGSSGWVHDFFDYGVLDGW